MERTLDNLGDRSFDAEQLNNTNEQLSKEIIQATIHDPISRILSLYEKRMLTPRGSDYDEEQDVVQEKEIISILSQANLEKAFENPELRKGTIHYLIDLFSVRSSYKLQFSFRRKSDHGSDIDAFYFETAKSVLRGIDKAIEEKGVSDIEDNPFLFRLLDETAGTVWKDLDIKTRDNLKDLMVEKGAGIEMLHLFPMKTLLDHAYVSSPLFKEKIDDKLRNIFSEKKWGGIYNACASDSPYLAAQAMSLFETYVEGYGLPLNDFKHLWGFDYSGATYDVFGMMSNMEMVEALETERPGIVKVLFEDFGIKEFMRYPKEVLIRQFDLRGKNVPYGLVAFTNEDHNKAFDYNPALIQSVFEQTKNENLNMRIIEFMSQYELVKRLAYLEKSYGKNYKISYLILGAHGSSNSFQVSSRSDIRKTDFDSNIAERIKGYFAPHPEVAMASCSTGTEGGIGQKISASWQARVHAPMEPAALVSMNVSFDEDSKPRFSIVDPDNIFQVYDKGQKQNKSVN